MRLFTFQLALVTFLCLACTIGVAQRTDSTAVVAGDLVPVWYNMHLDIKYPGEAMDANLEGTVLIGITVDTLCQVKGKRIIQDIGMGCGQAALAGVNKDFELGLMKRFDFKCRTGEIQVAVRFELDD